MTKLRLHSLVASFAVTGLVLGASVNAAAADAQAERVTETPTAHFSHNKTGHPFQFREVNRETAEFARMETAPDNKATRRGPPMKTGSPHVNLD